MIPRPNARSIPKIAGPLLVLVLIISLWPRHGVGKSHRAAAQNVASTPEAAERPLTPLVPAAPGGDSIGSFRRVAENGALALYLDFDTTEIAVRNKGTGEIWYSNPPKRQEIEQIAQGEGLDELGSQFTMSYYRHQRSESLDRPTVLMKHITANNRAESVRYNQFKIYGLKNGVRIEYVVGKAWEFEDYIPKLIDRERFDRLILNRLAGAEDRRTLLDNYIPVTFVKANAGNRIALTEIDKRKLFGNYTLIPLSEEYQQKARELAAGGGGADGEPSFARQQLDDDRRAITMDFINTITDNRQGGIGLNQLKPQDFTRFRDKVLYYLNPPPKFLRISMAEIIQKAKYTPLDVQEDCRQNGIDGPVPDPGVFTIPMEYTLDGGNLVARIPCRELKYPRDVIVKDVGELNEKVTFPLESIDILPYFGAADPAQQGEIFVPDGSGALIHLNNGKTNAGGYIAPVYGRDNSSEPKRSERLAKRIVHLPVFGMRQGARAFLGIIEEGAALAKIRAEVAGRINSYNSVSAEFTTMPVTAVGFGAVKITEDAKEIDIANEEGGVATVYQNRLYQGDIRIRYAFLSGRDAGYVGMAEYYREYLMRTKGLTKLTPPPDLPFFLELVGSISVKEPVMGINRDVMEPLTTFTQGGRIAQALFAGGVANLKLEYNGLFRGGVEHEYPAQVRLAGELGKKQDLARLDRQLKTHDSQIYPRVNLLNVYRIKNGFNKDTDAARYLNRLPARVFTYNRATYLREPGTERYVVSPAKLDDLVGRFLKGYRRYTLTGLSIGVMGVQLNGDYRENAAALIDRQQALDYTTAQYKKINGNDLDLLVTGANDYALPYVRNISEAPMESSHGNIIDEDVPFYQIVLHGLVNLAGDPLNLADDHRESFLKAMETGSSLNYRWFYRESALVKNTRFADLYAGHYRDWLPDALKLYREANLVLGGLQDKLIVGHERLMDNVYRTIYENGRAVVVNYGDRAVVVDGITVKARDYALQAFAM